MEALLPHRERATMLAILALAGLACLLGIAAPVPLEEGGGAGAEIVSLIRVGATTALVIALLLGPGILIRAAAGRRWGLAFLPLPGLALLILTGTLAWLLAGPVGPRVVSFAVCGPILGLMLGALLAIGPEELLDPEERRVLGLVSLALGLAIGRTLWSLSTAGELYEGTISRNLVAEGRPDSRISYFVPQLIANNSTPYSAESNLLFGPYNFSSRGPLPGLAATPIVFLTGSRPASAYPELPWHPFDAQGFMAYRLAIMTFNLTCLLSLWELVRRLSDTRGAHFALLLGLGTPFLFLDTWFTWPKLLAASFVLLGAICVIERKPLRGGLLVGFGYLMHPSAIFWLCGIGLIALWPIRGANWRRPNLKAGALLAGGAGVVAYAWRRGNGPHYFQGPFLEYFTQAIPNYHPSVGEWLNYRLTELGNTLVPLFLPIVDGHDISINTFGGISPGVVHFFFQYWVGVPFGFAIVFFPFLVVGLWRALRRWPWAVTATILFPFALFAVYWGATESGLLREGMQAWVLALLAVLALEQAARGFPWARSHLVRWILALRAVEVLVVALGPVLGTHSFRFLNPSLEVNDAAALAAMIGCGAALAVAIFKEAQSLSSFDESPPDRQKGKGPAPAMEPAITE